MKGINIKTINQNKKEILEYVQDHPLFSIDEVLRDADTINKQSTSKNQKEVTLKSPVLRYVAVAAGGIVSGYLLKTVTSSAANLIGGLAPPEL